MRLCYLRQMNQHQLQTPLSRNSSTSRGYLNDKFNVGKENVWCIDVFYEIMYWHRTSTQILMLLVYLWCQLLCSLKKYLPVGTFFSEIAYYLPCWNHAEIEQKNLVCQKTFMLRKFISYHITGPKITLCHISVRKCLLVGTLQCIYYVF